MIVAEGLTKTYRGRRAIDNVSFTIREGEIVGLLGLNGAGKSTILKILGCFLVPSGGTARVAGFSVDSEPHEIRKLIGYLPDTPPLYNEMTIQAYLNYVARLKGVAGPEVEGRVRSVMERTNVLHVAESRLGELSHGFRQRVGIAQALVHNPRVLILDEPINGLDPVQIVEMRDLIVSLKGRHTVVLSSHILSEITRTCDRILIVDQGRLVAEGAEADLQGRMAREMRINCEVDRIPPGLVDGLVGIPGVVDVRREATGHGTERLVINTSDDVRVAVSRSVVEAGAGIVNFSREAPGLEGIFMKMIRSGEAKHG